MPIHKSIRYADDALGGFFEEVKKYEWYENTIFLVTADHTAELESKKYTNSIGRFLIPLIVHDPTAKIVPRIDFSMGQQIDVAETIFDLLELPGEQLNLFGTSLLRENRSKVAYMRDGKMFKIIDKDEISEIKLHSTGSLKTYAHDYKFFSNLGELDSSYHKQKSISAEPSSRLKNIEKYDKETLLKATIQYHHAAMIENAVR